jgi:hypothetical protein
VLPGTGFRKIQQEATGNHGKKFPAGMLLPQNHRNESEPDCSAWMLFREGDHRRIKKKVYPYTARATSSGVWITNKKQSKG